MKIKSLLFAALVAGMSFAANAETAYTNVGDKMTAPDFTLKAGENNGDYGLLVTMTRVDPRAADFTNVQFDLVFPIDANGKGLRPVISEGLYDWYGDDIPCPYKNATPCIAYSNNFDMPEKYPVHTVVGKNVYNNMPVESNPCQLYCISIGADEGMLTGDYQIKVKNLKYTCYNDDSFATADEQVLCNVHVDGTDPVSAVNDIKVAGTKTYKTIENGQVVIVKGDAKFNIMGQEIK